MLGCQAVALPSTEQIVTLLSKYLYLSGNRHLKSSYVHKAIKLLKIQYGP